MSSASETASKTASKRDKLNGTERDGWRRFNVIIRGYMGLTERNGTEWNRSPMFRKQQAVGSSPTAGSHNNPEFKWLSRATVKSRLFVICGFDSTPCICRDKPWRDVLENSLAKMGEHSPGRRAVDRRKR